MRFGRLLIFAVCLVAAATALQYAAKSYSTFGTIRGHTVPLPAPVPAYTRALRPKYPYSIVPGGVYSGSELQYADREDPVVKEHYADFKVRNVRMVQLTEDRFQYASYRLKNKIFWTRKRLKIPKGEILLTDGASFARARCGNRLSETPHSQVSSEEPPLKALSVPNMTLGEPMELAETPPLGELAQSPPLSDVWRFAPVVPPAPVTGVVPAELPPVTTAVLLSPTMPPVFLSPPPPASISPRTPTPNPSPTPSTTPTGGAPPVNDPPIVIPLNPQPGEPPVSAVPEPKGVYLFLVTFVLALYGLSRMVSTTEEGESQAGK